MLNLVIVEFVKIKRYNLQWILITGAFFPVLMTALQMSILPEDSGISLSYHDVVTGLIWNNCTIAFPFVIAVIGGMMMDREFTDNTLKSVLTVPVAFRKLLAGKLVATAVLSQVLAVLNFAGSIIIALILGVADITPTELGLALLNTCLISLCSFVAVAPLIAICAHKQGRYLAGIAVAFVYGVVGVFIAGRELGQIYPVTAGLYMIDFEGMAAGASPVIPAGVLLATIALTVLAVLTLSGAYEKLNARPQKKKQALQASRSR